MPARATANSDDRDRAAAEQERAVNRGADEQRRVDGGLQADARCRTRMLVAGPVSDALADVPDGAGWSR